MDKLPNNLSARTYTESENQMRNSSDSDDMFEGSSPFSETRTAVSVAAAAAVPIANAVGIPSVLTAVTGSTVGANSQHSHTASTSATEVQLLEEKEKQNKSQDKPGPAVKVVERILPRVNCPEKIIICIDLCSEPSTPPFKLGDGSRFSPLYMMKRVIEIFVNSKHLMDKRHQFTVVTLQNSAGWLRNFTSNPKEIVTVLEDLGESQHYETFDLSSLFHVILEHVSLPTVEDPAVIPPPYIVRTVVLYGRSHCIPEFLSGRDSYQELASSHYFTLDMFYIHETPSEINNCEEIFNTFCELDEKGLSYVFEISRNATKLHDNMAKLLAHPLQRPLQPDTHYRIGYAAEG